MEILAPLFAVTVLTAWGMCVGVFLNGVGKLREQAVCAVAMAAASFGLKWLLARHVGVSGIPIAAVVAYVGITFIPLTILLRKMFATPSWS